MVTFIITAAMVSAALVSSWGWGRIVTPICYRGIDGDTRFSFAYIVTLGLAVLMILGGVLNLLRIAYPMVLEILFVFGIGIATVFAALALRSHPGPDGLLHRLRPTSWSKRRISGDLIPLLIILMVTGFFAATLMPTSAFNFHDDFHKYLVTPVRMLQTGSLGGGPFEVVGYHHLGVQSFFQAFILTRFETAYINGFDSIFCFLVAGLLLNDIGRKVELRWLYRTVAVLCFVLINPQYVNISALYSAVLIILATVYAALLFAEVSDATEFKLLIGAAAPVGLFLACLISLKATFVAFALLFGAALLIGFMWMGSHRGRVAAACGFTVVTAAVALVPWSVISENNLFDIFGRVLNKMGLEATGGGDTIIEWGRLGDLFLSRQELFYGGWLPGYNVAMLTVAAAALVSGHLVWHNREQLIRRYLMVGLCLCLAAVLAYLLNAYLFAVRIGRIDVAVRYFAPILIAAFPAAAMVLGQIFWRFRPVPPATVVPASPGSLVLLAAFVLVAGMFTQTFTERAAQMAEHRNDLSFPLGKSKSYLTFNRVFLSPDNRDRLRGIQSKAAQGMPVFAWISAPFQLDFGRNPILTMEAPGLVIRKADELFGNDAEAFRKSLRKLGVRYVLWQPLGYGMRSERSLRRQLRSSIHKRYAKSFLDLRALMASLVGKGTVLYKDKFVVLFDIGEE